MEEQAPICPFCFDDHSSNNECDELRAEAVLCEKEMERAGLKIEELRAQLVEANAELKQKNEDGCCFVEHGYRMEAEHRLKDLQTQHATLLESIGPVLASFKKMKRNLHRDNWMELRKTLLDLETFNAKVGQGVK